MVIAKVMSLRYKYSCADNARLCCNGMFVCAGVQTCGLLAVGSEFWKQLCEEHGISGDGTLQEYASHVRQD